MVENQQRADDRYTIAIERANALNAESSSMLRYQAELMEKQNEMQEKHLVQFDIFGKDQNAWHAAIDTDINSVRDHMMMLSVRVGAMEEIIDRLAQLIQDEPDHERQDVMLRLLETIAAGLDSLNGKFDTFTQAGEDEADSVEAYYLDNPFTQEGADEAGAVDEAA
jgi:hypothetical protein